MLALMYFIVLSIPNLNTNNLQFSAKKLFLLGLFDY